MNRRTALTTLGAAGLGLLATKQAAGGPEMAATDDQLTMALAGFTEKSRDRLIRVIEAEDFTGRIPPSDVKAICDTRQDS